MIQTGYRFRAALALFVALALGSLSLTAQAANTPLLSSLHQFRIHNFAALNAFYYFSANGHTDTLNQVVAGINGANAEMNEVGGQSGDLLDSEQVSQLQTEFDRYKKLMRDNINYVRENSYPDLRLVSDMANQAQALSLISDELYDLASTSDTLNTDERVEAARAASLLMAKMMTKYAARSTSSVSQTFQGADSEMSLDQQAKQFDTLMKTVSKGNPRGELRTLLGDISSKWGFIRSSYVNYNQRNVSFVINRYSGGIVSDLNRTINLLQGGDGESAAGENA
ncbi:hypothetical protein C8D92_10254 [Tamilnaduibacter salinus]|uniref:PilJ/NarX-like methyl-accepting chemotaxis transducer n=1 Tax=Tamilnaduibacter salinus TaxID=1484056 RepID=A0A2A2I3Q5_9GAMM|nr:hypothetical protein [Tamilnaduibacter salinus]PAV26277.1 hypothetical protein CF392_06660 [Tamilnaduibacter salinus]PVY78020.1 hypothetical protein C8D92_10254 [Tamilnaduibacter salinus]